MRVGTRAKVRDESQGEGESEGEGESGRGGNKESGGVKSEREWGVNEFVESGVSEGRMKCACNQHHAMHSHAMQVVRK